MPSAEPRFWAFISYSHADEAWAKWLHVAIERYRVPKSLVGRATARGVVPRRLIPIFRDRDELPGSPSLANEISDALEKSRSLIVICSPKAAVSRYVSHEVVAYKRRGRENDIFCLLVDGEPHSTDRPESGDLEAFPAPIRFKVSAAGAITSERAEPLAADLRPGRDTRLDAKLKLISGILGVGFDELKRRESRRRLYRQLQLAAASLVIVAAVSAVWWNRQQALERQTLVALSQQLAAQSREYESQRPELSSLLAIAALDVSDTAEARSAVYAAAARVNEPLINLRDPKAGDAHTAYLSPNGRILAVGTADGHLTFWDSTTSQRLGGSKSHVGIVTAGAFSHDQREFVSGSSDGTIVLWDARAFNIQKTFKPEAGRVLAVAFGPDGTTVRTVCERESILWRTSDGTRLLTVPVENIQGNQVDLSSDGTRVAIAGGMLQIWNPDTDRLLATIKPQGQRVFRAHAFNLGERAITTIDDEGDVVTWNADTGRKMRQLRVAKDERRGYPDLLTVASARAVATYGREIVVTDLTDRASATAPILDGDHGRCLAMSEDAGTLAWCSGKGLVSIWNRKARPMRAVFNGSDVNVVTSVAFSHDGRLLASGDGDGKVILWNADGEEVAVLKGQGMTVSSVAFGGNEVVAAGMRHGRVTVWNISEPDAPIALLDGGGVIGTQVVFSHDGATLASATEDTIALWNATSWESAAQLQNSSTVRHVAFNPGDTILATANSDGTVTLWNVAERAQMATLHAHRGEVMGLAFSSDGKRLATVGRDRSVIIWDVQAKAQLSRFDGLDEIFGVAFSPDDRFLAHGSDSGRLILRDVVDFRQVVAIRNHEEKMLDLAFSPDGRRLATADGSSLTVWNDLDPASWKRRACMNAGRNLSEDEWKLFSVPARSRVVCPDLR